MSDSLYDAPVASSGRRDLSDRLGALAQLVASHSDRDERSLLEAVTHEVGAGLEARVQVACIIDAKGAATQVVAEGLTASEGDLPFVAALVHAHNSCALPADEIARQWPEAPAWARDGLVLLVVELEGKPAAALAFALPAGRKPGEREATLASSAAHVIAAGLSAARAQEALGSLLAALSKEAAEAQRQGEEAARQASEKTRLLAELDEKLRLIDQQQADIRQLSSPVLEVWDGVLAVPLVGAMSHTQLHELTERLLHAVASSRAKHVLVDATGLTGLDPQAADELLKLVGATRLLGARCVLTGLSPAAAQAMVALDIALGSTTTMASVRDALRAIVQQSR